MPFARDTLTTLRTNTLADIQTRLPGSAPFQRRTVENVLGTVFAGFQDNQFGYLDWISRESVPFTADGEYQIGWAALRGVTLLAPIAAVGTVSVVGAIPNKTIVTGGPQLLRSDGALFAVTAGAAVASDGTATVGVTAVLAGSAGDCAAGMSLSWVSPIDGIPPTVTVILITGGADLETSSELQSRSLAAWANPPQGGDLADYVNWTLEYVPSVTRAWSGGPTIFGDGSVTIYFCIDDANHTNGIPNGSNGGSQYEPRITQATGDQLLVANAIYPVRAATALVVAAAPTPVPLNLALQEVPDDATIRAGIAAALSGLIQLYASPVGVLVTQRLANGLLTSLPGGTIPLSYIEAAVAAVPGLDHFLITSPSDDVILTTTGELSVPGSVSYSFPS